MDITKLFLISVFCLLLIYGCSKKSGDILSSTKEVNDPIENKSEGTKTLIKEFTLLTEDNVKISASYLSKEENKRAVILLHMLNSNKESWNDFAKFIVGHGYNPISIDLRGHGKSLLKGKSLDEFSKQDFNSMVLDVDAAYNFLQEQGIHTVVAIGASIGANLAFISANSNKGINAVVLLSPGLEYKGIAIDEKVEGFNKPLLIITGEKDEYSASSSKYLKSALSSATLEIFEATSAHGTNLFQLGIGLENIILSWLNSNIQ